MIERLKQFLYGIAVLLGALLMIIPIMILGIIDRLKEEESED